MGRARPVPVRPGYEPAKGFPDPLAAPPPTYPAAGYYTHLPHSNGPVCGQWPPPTDAKMYDPVAPNCPKCAAWLAAATAVTKVRYPGAFEAPPPHTRDTEPPPGEGDDDEDPGDPPGDAPPATPRDRP